MEADDELISAPDARGFLDLTNRAWVNLDPVIWTMTLSLITLDISYNHLKEIPPQIGELVLLKELRASFNKIASIPPEIGKIRRLRKLILNSNRIRTIPNELGRLEQLEELILSENSIEELPHTIELMGNLRILRLGNNKLKTLPFEIAEIITLEEIDCSNNAQLDMVPARWRGDTESVLFTCKLHRDYHTRMEEVQQTNGDLAKHSQYLEQEQLVMKETIADLRYQVGELQRALPKKIAKKLADQKLDKLTLTDEEEKKKNTCVIS